MLICAIEILLNISILLLLLLLLLLLRLVDEICNHHDHGLIIMKAVLHVDCRHAHG